MVRGVRNNNPGNLRLSNDNWVGLSEKQTDGSFFQFDKPEHGIRALTRVLINYQNKHGLNTVREIISRYAPPNENNTESYINAVAKFVGVAPDDYIIVELHMDKLVRAIIKHENGFIPYSHNVISDGISLA